MKRKLIRRFQNKLKTTNSRYFRKYLKNTFFHINMCSNYVQYHAWDESYNNLRHNWVPLKMSSTCQKSKIIHISDGSQSYSDVLWNNSCPGRMINDTMLKSNREIIRNIILYEKKVKVQK